MNAASLHYSSGKTVLSEDPRIFVVKNFISQDECTALVEHVKTLSSSDDGRKLVLSNAPQVSLDISKLWPLPLLSIAACVPRLMKDIDGASTDATHDAKLSDFVAGALPTIGAALVFATLLATTVLAVLQNVGVAQSRTSQAVALNSEEDVPFVKSLVNKVCEVTQHPWDCFEAPVVSRYSSGALFRSHNDASPRRGAEWADLGGQRVVTAIIYLNTCTSGGATRFDKLGLQVQPEQGSVLVFYPSNHETLVADGRTSHEAMPAVDEKWIVQLFGRVGPIVPPPLGLPQSFANK